MKNDPDYACMNCCSHDVDEYESEETLDEGWLMWTYCRKCDVWTSHKLTGVNE